MVAQDVMIDGLSDRIREQRKKMGITQGELADRIGGGLKTVNDYERGARQPSYEKLLRLATLFNVSTDYLLGVKKY
ncbi:MAG TPA: transcriptional regulator [Lachnospiraceae bacterium]|nr:transcriptional regulator [Lachnospiraceae bacterium]